MNMKRVVGVSYDADDSAPIVVLKGAGAEADQLLAQARQGSTPIVHAPDLAAQLYRTPIDAPIGRELFPVMALLLAHVLQADRFLREKQE